MIAVYTGDEWGDSPLRIGGDGQGLSRFCGSCRGQFSSWEILGCMWDVLATLGRSVSVAETIPKP